MKVCDRCRVSGCLLDYGGEACRNARRRECPDVVFTRIDEIREMEAKGMAGAILQAVADTCDDGKVWERDLVEWLLEPVEVM